MSARRTANSFRALSDNPSGESAGRLLGSGRVIDTDDGCIGVDHSLFVPGVWSMWDRPGYGFVYISDPDRCGIEADPGWPGPGSFHERVRAHLVKSRLAPNHGSLVLAVPVYISTA